MATTSASAQNSGSFSSPLGSSSVPCATCLTFVASNLPTPTFSCSSSSCVWVAVSCLWQGQVWNILNACVHTDQQINGLTGPDEMMAAGLMMGSDGAIGSTCVFLERAEKIPAAKLPLIFSPFTRQHPPASGRPHLQCLSRRQAGGEYQYFEKKIWDVQLLILKPAITTRRPARGRRT